MKKIVLLMIVTLSTLFSQVNMNIDNYINKEIKLQKEISENLLDLKKKYAISFKENKIAEMNYCKLYVIPDTSVDFKGKIDNKKVQILNSYACVTIHYLKHLDKIENIINKKDLEILHNKLNDLEVLKTEFYNNKDKDCAEFAKSLNLN